MIIAIVGQITVPKIVKHIDAGVGLSPVQETVTIRVYIVRIRAGVGGINKNPRVGLGAVREAVTVRIRVVRVCLNTQVVGIQGKGEGGIRARASQRRLGQGVANSGPSGGAGINSKLSDITIAINRFYVNGGSIG